MGKFKMPTVQQFLQKKRIYDDKKDPVWVYLENEMRENHEKGIKPYNEIVGEWLRFLKDLRFHYYCEIKKAYKSIQKACGPPWYCELSTHQRDVLDDLKANIHQDLLEDMPIRTRQALSDLGLTLKISTPVLMQAMMQSFEDPGVFIWYLYKSVYKKPPNELRSRYDMNAMILMSSLVFIDLAECIERLEELLGKQPKPLPPPKKITPKYYEPKMRYGVYHQKMYATYISKPDDKMKNKTPSLSYKLRLRSEKSYEKLCNDMSFLEKRMERNKKAAQEVRICNYKFWEPPSTLRNTDPKMVAYVEKLKMIKLKAKLNVKSHFKNMEYQISGVAFIGGKPQYMFSSVALLPTGYIPVNGGISYTQGAYISVIQGFWKYPIYVEEKCMNCDCLSKWDTVVMKYLEESKCKCGHLYDFYRAGVVKEKYFHKPTRHGPFWIDEAQVYQMDPMENFIRDTVQEAVLSTKATPEASLPALSAEGIREKDLLAAFLGDLSETPLLIPHLPQACLLNNLQEWVRHRVKGKLDPKQHKRFLLQSQRQWLQLKHMDFRARAFRIPFTKKELEHFTWAYRSNIQVLFNKLMENFVTRNRTKQVEQTRLWWATTKFDAYPSKAFLDIFFTYMPGRMKDTFLINPYSSELTPKYGAKTCPLN